ncbi:hypothetical protein Tco_1102005 [Tanacetum coccineum]
MDGIYGRDDDGDSSGDDTNDKDKDDEEEEEEEEDEHLAPANSAIFVHVDELVFPPEGIEPVIPPPSTDITIGARITVRPQASISLPPEAEVKRLLAMTTPITITPISLSPPSAGSEQPPHKRLYLSTLGSRYEVVESSTARPTRGRVIDYGFVSTVDVEERSRYIIERDSMDGGGGGLCFQSSMRGILDRIVSGALFKSFRPIVDHVVHRTLLLMQQAELAALRETDRRRQAQMVETLRVIRDMRREMSDMQAELLTLREQQRRARQPGPKARILDHQDASGDADSHI